MKKYCFFIVLLCLSHLSCQKQDARPFSVDFHEAALFKVDDGFKFSDIDSKYPGESVYGNREFAYYGEDAKEWSRMDGGRPVAEMTAFAVSFDLNYTSNEEKIFKQNRSADLFQGRLYLGISGDPNSPPNPSTITKYIKIENIDRKNRSVKNCTLFGVINKSLLWSRRADNVVINFVFGEFKTIVPLNIDESLLSELRPVSEPVGPKLKVDFNEDADTFRFVDNQTNKELVYSKLIWDGREVFYIGYEQKETKGLTGRPVENPGLYLAFSKEEIPQQKEIEVFGQKTMATVKNGGTTIIVYRDRVRNDLILNYSLENGVLKIWK
jgi:hypothetical protein